MSVGPFRFIALPVVEEGGLQGLFRRQHPGHRGDHLAHHVRGGGGTCLLRLHHVHRMAPQRAGIQLLLQALHALPQFRRVLREHGGIGIDGKSPQEGVPHDLRPLQAGDAGIHLREMIVDALQVPDLILGPRILRALSQMAQELLVAARTGKEDLPDAGGFVKFQKLPVAPVLRSVLRSGHDADHVRQDLRHPKHLHDAHPLVSLLDIEAVAVFVDLHRVPESLLRLDLHEADPFGGKLRVFLQQRIEFPVQGGLASRRPGAGDEGHGDLPGAQGDLPPGGPALQDPVQYRGIGILPPGLGTFYMKKAFLPGLPVIFSGHSVFLSTKVFLSDCFRAGSPWDRPPGRPLPGHGGIPRCGIPR